METETAYAKVNLALHVRARRVDGYHELESLFAFCADGDALSARVREDDVLTLTIDGPFADGLDADADNLVLRAGRALQSAAGVGRGADIHLAKTLPIAAGIGGGSADAAAAMRLLIRLWDVQVRGLDMAGIALALGADVPACLGSRTVFGSGVGEQLQACDVPLSGLPILLVNPRVSCPTGPVFRGWDGVDRGALNPRHWREGRNDLQPPAVALVPVITDVLVAIGALPGVTYTRMSGSGATCFALFEDEGARDAAEAALNAAHPGWWTTGSVLR